MWKPRGITTNFSFAHKRWNLSVSSLVLVSLGISIHSLELNTEKMNRKRVMPMSDKYEKLILWKYDLVGYAY